jgi:hypothetical protein
MEAAARLHGRTDDEELRTSLRCDARNVFAEAARPRADDLPLHRDAVRACHRGGRLEPLLEAAERTVHVRVQRQLPLDHERPEEDDPRTAVGGQTAGEIERVLGLIPVEQRHDDAAVGDRARPAREPSRPVVQEVDVRKPHRKSWYGTEARITCGSTSRSRFT